MARAQQAAGLAAQSSLRARVAYPMLGSSRRNGRLFGVTLPRNVPTRPAAIRQSQSDTYESTRTHCGLRRWPLGGSAESKSDIFW